jgi:hypothetical protein
MSDYCHRVPTQLQLIKIYHIIYHIRINLAQDKDKCGVGCGWGGGERALENTPMKLRFYTTRENIYSFLE